MLIGERYPSKYEHNGIGPPSLAQVEESLLRVAQVASEVEFHVSHPLPDRPRCHLIGNVGTSLPHKNDPTKVGQPKVGQPSARGDIQTKERTTTPPASQMTTLSPTVFLDDYSTDYSNE